jgi:hypothetical protein
MTKKNRVPSNAYFPEGLSTSAERSSNNYDQYTGSQRSLTSSRLSSVEGDSVVQMDDDTMTKDDETFDRGDSVLDTEDDDDNDDQYYDVDDDTQEETGTNGSDDETDTCMMSIDEHLARRHAKWFAMRFGRELKLCSTEGPEFESSKTKRNPIGYDGDGAGDANSSSSDDSLDEHDDAGDIDTATFNRENDAIETKTLKKETGTETGLYRSFNTMKSETSTKSETATTRSETATKSQTTSEGERGVINVENSNSSSRQKSVVKPPPPPREPKVAAPREFSPGQDTQMRRKKKKSPIVAVAATTDKSYRVRRSDGRKLHNVSQLSIVDIASSNRDISVVEPLKKRDAREAFLVRDVPQEIPAHSFLRDDISSMAPPVRSPYTTGLAINGSITHHGRNVTRTKVLPRSRSQDVELGTDSDPSCAADESLEKEQIRSILCLQRRGNDLELFFIGLISISLLVLVILLVVIVSRH